MADRRIPWSRILAEGVVIVGSILVAFALDAWWSDQELAREVDEDLASLESEVSLNLGELRQTREIQRRIADALVATSGRLAVDPAARVMVPDTLVWWSAFNNPTFDPSFGSIEALTASGRLAAIEDPVLRQEIAKLRGRFGDLIEEQIIARQIVVEQIYPLLGAEGFDLARFRTTMQGYVTPRPSLGTGTTFMAVPSSGDVPIPNSPDLRFALDMRAMWYLASNQEFAGVEQALEGTLEMIDAYRSGRE